MKKEFLNKFANLVLSKEVSAKLVGGRTCQTIDCGDSSCFRTENSDGITECCGSRRPCWSGSAVSNQSATIGVELEG